MNCAEFDQIVTDLVRGSREESSGRDSGVHARECGRCRSRLAEQQTLTKTLAEFGASFETEAPPPKVEEALLAAFRLTALNTISRSHGTTPPLKRWAIQAIAASALAAIALVVLWIGPEPLGNVPTPGTAEPPPDAAMIADFLPLPYTGPLDPWEHGRVVRVRLPSSMLIHFGLPVSAETSSHLVEVNVLLGEDGMARGVALVATNGAGR